MAGLDDEDRTVGELYPALVTCTSGELLGRRALPKPVSARPVCFMFGPPQVGKSSVARRVVGADALCRDGNALNKALTYVARHRRWPAELIDAPHLVLDDIERLHQRFGAISLLGSFLRTRVEAGRRTVLCQGPNDSSITVLYDELLPQSRSSVLLRFPVGRGRRRFVANRCRARGIDCSSARGAVTMEPWTYVLVEQFLDVLGPPAYSSSAAST